MSINNDIRHLTVKLLQEYDGDRLALYAHVSNHTIEGHPDEELIAVKRELERQIVVEMMGEHGWDRTDISIWQKTEDDEFWVRLRSARED